MPWVHGVRKCRCTNSRIFRLYFFHNPTVRACVSTCQCPLALFSLCCSEGPAEISDRSCITSFTMKGYPGTTKLNDDTDHCFIRDATLKLVITSLFCRRHYSESTFICFSTFCVFSRQAYILFQKQGYFIILIQYRLILT